MSLRQHLVFWLAPLLVGVALVWMFFSGVLVLRDIIAPAFNREFGMLESLQNLLLAAAFIIAMIGLKNAASLTERLGFVLLAAAFFLLLLEEMNYGANYWRLLTGQSLAPLGRGVEFNLHNKVSTSPLKTLANVLLLVFVVILPLLVRAQAPAWLRYLTPPRALIFTVLASICISKLAHHLDDLDTSVWHPLSNNIAEFRELFIYYIGLLYSHTLVFRRRWPGWTREGDILRRPD